MDGTWQLGVLTRAVYPLHGYGGLERHVYDLLRHLLGTRRVFITLICPPPARHHERKAPPEHLEVLRDPGLKIRHVPYRTFPFAGRRFTTVIDRSTAYPRFGERAGRLAAQLAATGEIDLVYGLGASVLGYARRHGTNGKASAPLVFNPQGLEEFGATNPEFAGLKRVAYRPLQAAVRTCAQAADRVIATDRSLEPMLEQHLRIPRSRIRRAPNAVDIEMCDRLARTADVAALRERHRIPPDRPILLSTGRLQENKGFHVLAEALAQLSRSADPGSSRWHWVLVGDGPYRQRLERAVDSFRLRSDITLPGHVTDAELHTWYEAATLFAHPTLYEGSSLVTLEAMAHRLPVLATRAGGLPDKVVQGVNGWLVKPGDAGELAGLLRDALATPAERLAEMGRESRALAERDFSWPAVANQLLAVCEELLDRAS
jgi:glycosyltransferase involved in cell wall biosynthesis